MSSECAPTHSTRSGSAARRARSSVSISPRTSPSWTAQPPAPQARGVRGRPCTQPVRPPHRRLRRGTRTPATGGLVAATTPQSRRRGVLAESARPARSLLARGSSTPCSPHPGVADDPVRRKRPASARVPRRWRGCGSGTAPCGNNGGARRGVALALPRGNSHGMVRMRPHARSLGDPRRRLSCPGRPPPGRRVRDASSGPAPVCRPAVVSRLPGRIPVCDAVGAVSVLASCAAARSLYQRGQRGASAHGSVRPTLRSSPTRAVPGWLRNRSEEHTSELQSRLHLVCRLLLEKKKKKLTHHAPADRSRTHYRARHPNDTLTATPPLTSCRVVN